MKKVVLFCLLILSLTFTACKQDKHDHQSEVGWELNKNEHWQVCFDCKEKFNVSHHALDEYGFCEVCEASIIEKEDDNYMITIYDEYGSIINQVDYDKDDKVLSEMIYEVEYYDDGNIKSEKIYHDDVLVSELYFARCSDSSVSEVYEQMDVLYESDGRKFVSIYNEHSMLDKYTIYDKDGNIETEDVYEYTYDESGNLTNEVCYTDGILSSKTEYSVDENGDVNPSRETFFDKDGNILEDYYYDEN